VSESAGVRVHGRALEPGTEVSITGERGRYRFVSASTTNSGRVVFDFIGGRPGHECWRSFYPERVKTVHRLSRTRANTKQPVQQGSFGGSAMSEVSCERGDQHT
jgi:hypothetical protein